MDTKTLVKALKTAVREVIKEELTEILREGLQSTIVEIKNPESITNTLNHDNILVPSKQSKVQFTDNKWASILNETESLREQEPLAMNSFRELMNEGMDEIRMTSRDAVNFGTMRQNMREVMGVAPTAPKTMEDPESGKIYEIPQEVQHAMTRDYSSLMKTIDKKRGIK